jgi:protein involved in polysaccharide export with SLBB domain
METTNPADNIVLQPYDVIHAFNEEMVYTQGDGIKAGVFSLNDRDSVSVVQLISMAGGLSDKSAPEKARVLRPVMDSSRKAEIPLNVKSILEGRASDFPLMPGDVLLVPKGGGAKGVLSKPLMMLPGMASALIWVVLR